VGEPSDHDFIADLGFQGKAWIKHWREHYQAALQTRAQYRDLNPIKARQLACRFLARLRQITENTNNYLTAALGLRYPRARTPWGLLTRIAAKVAAYDVAIYINYLTHRPTFSFFYPLS
jgi:hypothetical protein